MDEWVINDLYERAKSKGYKKSLDEFKTLLYTDQGVFDDMYGYVQSKGYKKGTEEFSTLIGKNQSVQQPIVKKKDDGGISESEPSKTEQGVDYKKAFTDYNKQLSEPKQSETDLVGRAQKVLGIKEPQQKQVGEYDPNAYIEGVATPKEPVVYIKPAPPFRNAEGGYGDVINQLDVIDKKIAESSPYEASLLILERNKLLLRKKEIEDSPVRTSDNRPFDITAPKFLEDGLNALTPKQLASYGAKGAKETFDYYFKDAGFKFETDREYVKAISPDGKEYTYNTLYPSRESLDEFKNFVRESAFNNPEIADKAYLYEKENKKFKTKEEINNEVKTINAQEEQFMGDYKKFLNLQRDIDEIEADLKRWRDSGEQNTPKYIQTEAYLNERKKELQDYAGTMDSKIVDLKAQRTQLDKAVGKYTEFQATQGDFGGTFYRAIAESSSSIFSQYLRIAVSKTVDFMPLSSVMGEEAYQDALNKKLKEKGYGDDKVVPIDILKEAKAEIEAEMGAEARNDYKVAARTGEYKGEKLNNVLTINGVRESLSEFLTAPITSTSEYKQKREEEGGFVERGLIGLGGSLPAMVGGKYVRYMNMFMMTTDAVMKEMDNNPNFAGISENEKELVALPIGVVGAALEEIGFRGLIKGKSFTSNIVKAVLGRVPAGASASVIRNTTFDVVAEMGIRGTSALVGATLSEAETGAAQQISEYAIKDIYNSMREKKMFDNPAFLSGQYLYDVYDAARTEAVGGFVMGVPYSAAAAFQKDGFQALDDATFKIFEDLAKDDNGRKFFVTSLKNKINLGEVTPNQGKQMLEAYDQSAGMIGRVPDEITDPQSRKIAMDLISERKKLEGKKEKYDDALAKPIQDKINQINEQLTQLTQDAIQKQAQPTQEQPAIPAEISNLRDDETVTFTVKSLDEIPEEFRDRASKKEGVEVEVRNTILGLPIGPKKTKVIGEAFTYSLTGKEAKDYAIQKQAAGQVSVQPEAGTGQEVEVGGPEAKPKITPEESKRKEALVAALEATDKDVIAIGDELLDRKEAQTELEAIIAKEQAVPAEQGGAEQAPAKLTPEERKAKEDDIEQRRQEEFDQYANDIIVKTELYEDGEGRKYLVHTLKNGKKRLDTANEDGKRTSTLDVYESSVPVENYITNAKKISDIEKQSSKQENRINAKYDAELAALQPAEVTPTEVTPAAEVTPVDQFTEQDRARKAELEEAMRKADKRRKNITVGETTMTKSEAKAELDALVQKEQAAQQPAAVEVAPTEVTAEEVVERTPEQEADLLEELLTGKKKEPTVTEVKAEPTSKEAIAKRLRGKKSKGLMSSIDFGISQALYNGALEFMASQVEKDTKLGNAIANTIKWIDERMQGKKWNKGAFGKYMNDTYKVTLGDGRQVDVLRDDSKETAEVINGWYQPIEQKIIDSKQDKQPANKWAEQLRSKEDEDLWTGVREFLESKGNQSVSKKELLDFMKDNRVEIVEVVKGGSQISLDEAEKIFTDKGYSVITDRNGDTYVEKNEELYDYEDMSKDEQEAFKVLTGQNLDSLSSKDDTKYSKYQLPGDKSNYKEVLVTMPNKIRDEFKSSHFDEPNILVHLRMNTRTDADGNKVLFLEEVQSDWGQQGKKQGFATTPTAPFVTDTNSWVKLGLKMALREAAAQGADKIAWTTGEQQNERYDLSKQIEKISYDKSDNTITAWNKDGKQVIQQTAKESELPNIIGKDVADKLLNQKEDEEGVVELSGQDIKVGGKGMKGFYDGIVPNVAKAVIKEITGKEGKITEVKIEGNTQQAIDVTPEMKTQAKTALPLFSGKLSDTIRGLEIKGPGGLQSNILGIPVAIWNAGVETVAKSIEVGMAVNNAIKRGINYIKEKHGKKINEVSVERKMLIGLYSGAIETAREAGITEEGLKTYLTRKGVTEEQIETLLKYKKRGEKKPISKEKITGKPKPKKVTVNDMTALKDQIKLEVKAAREGAKSVSDAVKAIVEYFNSIKDRGNLTRKDLIKILGIVSKVNSQKTLDNAANKIFEIIGKAKTDIIEVSDLKALKDQLRLEAKAAREAKGDLNAKRKMLTAAIKEMKKNGSISVRQAKALINRVNAVNLDNPVMVERLLDYAEKVFNDAAYAEKLSQANKLQSQIKQLSKNKEKFGNLTAFAAEFAKIDPALVEDIDEYIEMASNVKEGVQGSKVVGEKVIPADMVDVGKTMEYVNKTMEAQEETIRLKTAERLQELMGVDVSDLTYDQMMELLDTPTDKKVDKYKKGIIRGFIDRMFNTYSTIIKDMFETGIDPFSDPENPTTVEFKDSDKKIVEEFMAMDLSLLDEKEALRAADALNNFLTNKSTAGMVATLGDYNGRKNIKEVADKNIKAEQIKMYWSPILGRTFFQQIASIPAFFERLFKSYKTGRYIREMMGINSLINHKADAVTAANRVINNYIIEFSKKKPNNKNFQDISNIIERGIIGDLAKTIVGDAKQVEAEFNRRKKLIEQSIKILEKAGTKKELELAKTMKEVYDKIAKDSKTIEEVKTKADQINVDAVQFWVDQWAKLYDQFADVALNVYNRVLDKNVNYVPDRFGFLERAEKKKKDADGFESMFIANSNSEYFYKKEAGSLMKSTPPQSLLDEDGNSMDMYVNLSFDTNNANALMEALIDIKTAADIRQIQAFKNDSKFDDVFPFGKDAAAVKERIAALIRNIRNKRAITDKSFKEMVRKMDRIAAIGTSLLLAGPTQAISQTIPVAINTIINSKGKLNLSVLNNKDANRFIDESGMGIANRGSDAVTELETLNQKLEVASKTKAGAVVQYIENLNRKYLKLYLSNFDVFIARASWLTYYEKGLRKQGIKGKIDYSTHKQNKEAAQYAQDMLDRQQNISDKDLAGQLYQSDNPVKQFIVKVVMPLATFRMNQTTRFSNDLAILTSKTASTEERKEAAVSIGGFAAEMATFRAIKLYIGYSVFYSLAQMIRGEEDDEEEKQKTWDNMKRGAATSVVSDVFSPIPMTDVPTKILFAGVLDQLQNIAGIGEDDKFNIFTESKSSFTSDWGLLGVGVDKMIKLGEKVELARTGKFKDDFGNEKTISESDRALLSNPLYIGINVATVLGLNPLAPETDNVMNRITKMAKKNAMSNEQLKEAEELGVEGKKDLMKVKAEKKANKEEAYGGYKTLEEFEEKEPEKFDEYSAPGGKLDKYREQERKEDEEKNKDQPFRGLSEKKFKELYPEEWRKYYGPGTAYFRKQNSPAMLQKKAQEKMREAQREQKRKMAEVKRKQQEAIRKASGK